jgi:hypothetical protein
MLTRVVLAILVLMAGGVVQAGEIFLRWNQAGYRPGQTKVAIAMSEHDLAGAAWTLRRTNAKGVASGRAIARGVFGASAAAGPHAPLAFNHVADFTAVTKRGTYRLEVEGAAPAVVRIDPAPYARLLPLALRHLRVMRSGSHETLLRAYSHPGDARASVYVSDGDPANGAWKAAEPARTVNAHGGWYDAGDQIKFTLNQAYTVYHLLLAYRLAPTLFTKVHSRSELPDVLDEARHGLEFLARTHPDADTFVIQVGNAEDHNQPLRLPEHDALDGRRPALCALSRVHMSSAAAALALGAKTFRELGRTTEAERYAERAIAIYTRAQQADTIATAFERDQVNDFYRDPTDADQLALAAMELHALTGEARYLKEAKRFAPPTGREAGWHDWHWLANAALAPHEPAARERLLEETRRYATHAAGPGAPWGIPTRYVWGSLHRWIGAANAARVASLRHGFGPEGDALFSAMLDYTFGRNNWGVSFLFSEQLPNTLRNLYSPAYRLLSEFPTGALSEGPGNRATHDALSHYFEIAADDPFHRFNTPAAVFFDNATDFMCQEATISGQGDLVLMLTLASLDGR